MTKKFIEFTEKTTVGDADLFIVSENGAGTKVITGENLRKSLADPNDLGLLKAELGFEMLADRAGRRFYKSAFGSGVYGSGFDVQQQQSDFYHGVIDGVKSKSTAVGFSTGLLASFLNNYLRVRAVSLDELDTLYPNETPCFLPVVEFLQSTIMHLDSTILTNDTTPFDYATYNGAWESFVLDNVSEAGLEQEYATCLALILIAYQRRITGSDYVNANEVLPALPVDRTAGQAVIASDFDNFAALLV
jgi:hypothetical protein